MNKPKWKPLVVIQTYEDRQSQLAQRRCTIATPEEASERLAPLLNTSGNLQFPAHNSVPFPASANGPPPPPPMPCGVDSSTIVNGPNPDVNSNPSHPSSKPPTVSSPTPNLKPSSKPKAPPVPQKTFQQPLPPPCPTPDYDSLSISSFVSNGTLTKQVQQLQHLQNGIPKPPNNNNIYNKDCVDMDSLESFKLNNPCSAKPKPPNTYFNNKSRLTGQTSLGASPSSSQNSTFRKQRPVSVTIAEYPSGTCKRQPIKFEFLNGHENADQVDGPQIEPSETISSRFASELAQTLSRSNLRKRTEKMENVVNGTTTTKPQLSNGIVTISVNNDKSSFANSIQNQHKLLTKSQSTDVNMLRKTTAESSPPSHANRVTIKISDPDLKNGVPPSSILKNGNNCSSQHKPLVHQKSITFGEM